MENSKAMEEGWAFASKVLGGNIAVGNSAQYAKRITATEQAIEQLNKDLLSLQSNRTIDSTAGYAAEVWHAGTFNVNSAMAGANSKAEVLVGERNMKWSADIRLTEGNGQTTDYGLKYYKNATKTAKEQSLLNLETREPGYKGQKRLVPTDQLNDVKSYSEQKAINEHFKGRHDVASAHEDTLKNAVDRVSDGDIESNPLSKKESTKLAKEIKNGDVDVKKHGVTNDLVSTSAIMKKAVKAGLTAATISAIIQTTPEIVKAIDYLIKTKQLDMDQVKKIGKKAFNASVDGFMIGSISCVLQIKIAQGLLGTSLQTAMNSTMGPTFLGTVVSLLYTTVKNSILVANGKMTRKEMGSALVDTIIISGGYIAGSYIGGIIGQALGFTLPVIGYMLGSLVGCSLAAVYNIGKKKLISLCVDSGLTFFGMVDQDYSLPEEVLNDMGIDYASITRAEISRTQVEKSLPQTDLTRTRFETVDIKILRRGIIGVNKIGYVI